MSNFSTKAQLLGGGEVSFMSKATVRSYSEAQTQYPPEITNTTLTFRASSSVTAEFLERSININSTNLLEILSDISATYEVMGDDTTPQLIEAKLDDSRIAVTLLSDKFDTLEILANPISDEADAINYLFFHPRPHPSGVSKVGDLRKSLSEIGRAHV